MLFILCFNNVETMCSRIGVSFPFSKAVKALKIPVKIYDSQTFVRWYPLLDTNLVIKYNLYLLTVASSKNSNDSVFPCKSLKEFQCAPIGFYTNNEINILIYKENTTISGNDPVLIMETFNKSIIPIDHMYLFGNNSIDDFYSHPNYLEIIDSSHFCVNQQDLIYQTRHDSLYSPNIKTTTTYYTINKKGKILSSKIVFK